MKLYLIILICSLSFSFCQAQDSLYQAKIDQQINLKIKGLREEKTDTIICYYVNCIGSISKPYIPDTCVSSSPKYLIWLKGGSAFIQKFDECSIYAQVEMPLFLTPFKNLNAIVKSKIRPFEITDIVNGKERHLDIIVDHSCHYIFEIYTGKARVEININDFDLRKKLDYDKHINRNFYANQKSILNRFKLLTERGVDGYEKASTKKDTHK